MTVCGEQLEAISQSTSAQGAVHRSACAVPAALNERSGAIQQRCNDCESFYLSCLLNRKGRSQDVFGGFFQVFDGAVSCSFKCPFLPQEKLLFLHIFNYRFLGNKSGSRFSRSEQICSHLCSDSGHQQNVTCWRLNIFDVVLHNQDSDFIYFI